MQQWRHGGGLTLEPDTLIMHVGEEPKVLTASGEDKNGKAFASSDYSWSSEGDAIAISKVGYLCEVTALKPGTGTVTVKAGKFSAWCDVVVLDTVETVTLDKSTLELSVGESDTLTAEVTLTLGGAYSGSYEWSVTKGEDVIGISPSGNTCTVTAKAGGDATITVTVEGVSVECTVTVKETSENKHSYSQDSEVLWSWTGSDEEGWVATATVKCDDCDYTVDAIVEMTSETTKATCTEDGKTVYTATAKLKGETYEWKASKEVSIPATGHTYPDPSENYGEDKTYIVWEWASRSAETVNLKLYCVECGGLIETKAVSYTADTSNTNLLSASTSAGGYTYSDTYDTSKEAGAEHTHSYQITSWNWSDDYTSCTVTAQCVAIVGECDEKTYTLEATVTSETTEPTCGENGKIVYTAKVTIGDEEYSDTKTKVLDATGEHVFSDESEVSWSWTESNEKGWTATATVRCDNCSYTENLDVTVSKNETSATCTEKGKIVYTAVAKVGDGIEYTDEKEVEIPATGHTYPENGDVVNVLWDWENISEGKVEVTIKCTVCGIVIASQKVSYSEDENNPGYWVASFAVDEKTYESSFTIPEQSPEKTYGEIVKVDFNDGSFTSGTTLTEDGAALVDNQGNDTGFVVKVGGSTTQITTQNECTVLSFGGSMSTSGNALAYTLDTGVYSVVVSYFNGNAGRWVTVLNASGKDYGDIVAEDDKTTSDKAIKTRTITFEIYEDNSTIYIGSKSSGIYVTSIGIYRIEEEPVYTVEGIALSVEDSISLAVDEEVEVSAYVIMSDGKKYASYTDVEFNWSLSSNGVTTSGSGNSRTFLGVDEGDVVVTVSIDGYADCSISFTISVYLADIPTLGGEVANISVDFDDSSTYEWIAMDGTGVVDGATYTESTYGILSFVPGSGSGDNKGGVTISGGHLNTSGSSQSEKGRYFTIDLSDYIDRYVTITVTFNGTNNTDTRYLLLATSLTADETNSAVIKKAQTSSSSEKSTFTYSGVVTEETKFLYLTASANLNIYTIDIVINEIIDDSEPRVTGLTLTSTASVVNVGGNPITIEAIVKMNKGSYEGTYTWSLSEGWEQVFETDYSAGATNTNTLTLTPIAVGTVTITVTLEDGTSAACTLIVLEEGENVTELITSTFDYSIPAGIYGTSSNTKETYTQGIFTVDSGVRFESSDINTQGNHGITIEISGQDASISFTGTGASENATISVTLLKNGDDITPEEWASVNLAGSSSYNFTVSNLEEGTYRIVTSASVRIYSLTVDQYLPVSNPTGIVVTASSVDFLKGRTVSVNDFGLEITLVYENGREDSLIVSEVDIAMPSELSVGRHEVTVTYRYDKNGLQRDFSDTFYIYIYSIDSITISEFSMEYTSGTYYTNNVQKIFLVGSSINYDYAAVTATASCTYYDESSESYVTVYCDFILNSDEVNFSDDANMYVAGEYTVTATANMGATEGTAKTATYQINVVSKEGADITTVKVSHEETVSMDENGVYTVNTINDAIMLIKLLGATDEERKFIYVDEGTYEEKIYIDIPNLSLIGSNPTVDESGESLLATRSEITEIVFWAMNGLMDPSGTTTYSTVGSATVTVASQATGFYAANITFRNYWNTNDLYNEAKTITSSTQADAAYINADEVYFYNVTFTGYHDTLEAENGRQVYDHCYVEGRTDYIFGATATCYFKDCTIHSIGAGTDESNGGYVVAYKGNGNAGTVTYGYIFDGCTFEGDENVKEHSVALGRAWGEDMMMVIMNSKFDASFAMGGYTGASSALRYCQMNYNPDFTKIFEYNNTGDSAIGSGTSGYSVDAASGLVTDSNGNSVFTIPSEEKANDFADMSVIFAATNGTINYGSAWDGKCDVIKITVICDEMILTTVYGTGSMSVSDLKTAINLRLSEGDVETIYSDESMTAELTGSISSDMNVYISIGEKDMTVPESVTYDFSGADSTLNESYANEWLGYLYIDAGTNGGFVVNDDWYLLYGDASITIKLSAGSSVTLEMYSAGGLCVNGENVTAEEGNGGRYWYTYTVTSGKTESVILSCSGSESLYFKTIRIEVPVIYQIGDTIDFTNIEGEGYNVSESGTGTYKGVAIEGYFRNNSNSVQVRVGTVLKIQSVPGATAKISFYQDDYWVEADIVTDETGLITITITSVSGSGGYIASIRITEDVDKVYQIGEEINFVGVGEGEILSTTEGYDYNGVIITGSFRNNGNSFEVGEGTIIQIQSTPDASAEVVFYQNYTSVLSVSTDENGLITIVFCADNGSNGIYICSITIVSNPDYDEDSGEEPDVGSEDVYSGSIKLASSEIEVNVGKDGYIYFEVEVLLNGESFEGDVDITVQADDTYFAVDSWDGSSNYIKVTGVSAGSTYVTITLSVNGTILDTAICTVIVNTSSAGSGEEDESETIANVYEFSYEDLCQAMFGSEDVSDGTQLSAEYFTGKNSFITYTGSSSSNKIRNSSNGSAIEVKGDCLTVTFEGTGTLTISFSSTGNAASNISTIGVKDSAGNYLSGEADETSEGYSNLIVHTLSNGGCAYEISYNKFATVTFMVTEPGTYTIATCIATSLGFEVNDPDPGNNGYSDNRATRINAIVMIDNIVKSGNTSGGEESSSKKNFPDPDDAIHVVWDWEGRNEESQTVTVTIYSVEGELLTTETTAYNVDVNNPSYWYAEVSAGGITYANMYKIPGEGDAYSEESFIVPLAGSLEGISAQSFAENEQIEDNDLFTITAGVSLKYSGGTVSSSSTDGDANAEYGALQKGSNAISFTDMNGVVHNPDQGIVMSSAFTEKQDIDNIITITAKEDITLYVYVVFTNSSFNSNKKGKVYCTVNGGEKIGEEELTSRTALWSYGVNGISLAKGDVLVIGAEDSNGDKANFWFFGAEACTEGEKIDYADVKTVIFYTNQTSISTISKAVYNYSVVSAPVLPNVSGQYFVGWYMDAGCNVAYDFSEPVTSDLNLYAKWVTMDSEITYIQGAYESISLEFTDSNPSGAKIMYKAISESSYTVMTDVDAIRLVGDTTVRVDIMGLQGDTYYNVKVLTSGNEQLATYKIYVSSYDRSGYAHFNYSDGVGAYGDDGTLKDGALVIYVTEENKNDVTNDIYKYSKNDDTYTKVEWSELSQYLKMTDSGDLANYNRFAGTDYDGYVKGIGEILNNSRYSSTGRKNVGIAALCSAYGAVDVRIIGEVTASLVSGEVYWGYDDEEETDRWMVWGTYDIYGLSDLNPKADANSTDVNGGSHGDNGGLVLMRDAYNLTIEGVGEGAVLNGWGVTFMATEDNTDENVKTGKSFEVRNLTFVNYPEDAIGIQGTQKTVNSDKTQSYLTASAERIWVHNNTFYAGYCEYPAESDKGEGDGTCDFKRGQYFTLSYNYFEGCHKTDLFGADNNNLQFNISMHHNFWHNCQSRIPMTRNSNIHYYNNYVLVDDTTNIQYVMDARADAYIYAEYNYFEGCVDVFRSSDGTGTIKSYGNELVNCTTTSNTQNITPTNAETREEKVENSCGYWYYGIDYSSFDTNSALFYYDAAKGRSDCYLTSAEEAKEEVIRTAGALSRDKFTSCEQYVKAADIVKPTAPEFDLELESPAEDGDTDEEDSAGMSAYVIPYTESTKRYA